MNRSIKKYFILSLLVISFTFFFGFGSAEAATLNLTPENLNISEEKEFNIHVSVNSEGEIINAVEATINYPTDSLELVGVNRDNSVLDIWVTPPSVSTEDGRIEFMGGAQKGIGGEFLNILDIRFRALEEGSANISFSDGQVAAADGEGSHVLSETFGSSISIVPPEVDAPIDSGLDPIPEVENPPVEGDTEDDQVDEDQQPDEPEDDSSVETRVPEKPQVSIPLFPNQSRWYSYRGPFNVFWGVPENVEAIGIEFNDNPRFEPTEEISDVCCGHRFTVTEEGLFFVHVRFTNQFGWSDTYHHRIGIDYTPPIPFNVDIIKGGANPEIDFETRDGVSGIKEYRIYVDDKDPIITEDTRISLPEQDSGDHTIRVRAYDMANNFTEDVASFSVSDSDIASFSIPGLEGINDSLEDGIWIGIIIIIFGIAGWLIFRVYKS